MGLANVLEQALPAFRPVRVVGCHVHSGDQEVGPSLEPQVCERPRPSSPGRPHEVDALEAPRVRPARADGCHDYRSASHAFTIRPLFLSLNLSLTEHSTFGALQYPLGQFPLQMQLQPPYNHPFVSRT